MYSKFLIVTIASSLAIILVGCSEPTNCNFDSDDPVGSIQIVTGLQNDTLAFLPNDSSSVSILDVTVILTDSRGVAVQGELVFVTLSDTSLGSLSNGFPSLRDTTDSLGRVYLYYYHRFRRGVQIITATANGISASHPITTTECDESAVSLNLALDPDTVYGSEPTDIDFVLSCRVLQNGTIPVENYITLIRAEVTLGAVPPYLNLGPTDQFGRASTTIHASSHSGLCLYAHVADEIDTLCLTRLP